MDAALPGVLGDPSPRTPGRTSTNPRFVAAALSLALHAAALGAFAWRGVETPPGTRTIDVEIVADSAPSEPERAEPPPVAAPDPPPQPTPEPTPSPTPTPEPSPSPEPAPQPTPTPTPEPTVTPTPEPAPTPPPKPTPPAIAKPKPAVRPPPKVARQPRPAPALPRAAAATAGDVAEGSGAALSAARASYGAEVIAEIRARKFYPPAAAAKAETGVVGVLFTLGPSGAVASVRIIQSSGSAALDQAARTIVANIHPSPPPGGVYTATTRLEFRSP